MGWLLWKYFFLQTFANDLDIALGDFMFYFDHTCIFDPNSKVKSTKCLSMLDMDREKIVKDSHSAGERVTQYTNVPSCDKTHGQDPFYIRYLHKY